MISKDVEKLILSKYETGEPLQKIFRGLHGFVSYPITRRWCNMIRETIESNRFSSFVWMFLVQLPTALSRMIQEPWLTDEYKTKRNVFADWMFDHYQKEDTQRFVFSDEEMSKGTTMEVPSKGDGLVWSLRRRRPTFGYRWEWDRR